MNAPQRVLTQARMLCDDALFVHRVAVASMRYRDDRTELLKLPQTREGLKAPHIRMIDASRAYRETMRECGVPEDSKDMQGALARIQVCKTALRDIDSMEARLDKNVELESLCHRLIVLFDKYGVKDRKMKGFLCTVIQDISPPGEDAPSTSAIEKAVSNAKKARA
ncbi:hypothetical protein [Congregibacter litoralis]|uniref:Uncharacterized protein n=1 Tax=Congregibacter litoralis KT71 TaxID=314285 RepID=A4ACH3_9GAMM|nr:hypothetical protein [Congregibacter litoralis]EAQ96401.2 hypothetical protein KT71_13480 [Congregibacter litoralis KT71]